MLSLFHSQAFYYMKWAIALSLFFLGGFCQAQEDRNFQVLVSVAPHQFFVERIAGNRVSVTLLVPAGASAHTYEPTPKQMISASKSDLWFRIGEAFETRAMAALKSHRPRLVIIDMRNGLDLIGSPGCCKHHDNNYDLHFWLSARLAQQQARAIAAALKGLYPEHAEEFDANLNRFIEELKSLDADITAMMQKPHNLTVLVSHPAYAYFCRDYDLTQLSIEFEGRDPTPHQLTRVLEQARAAHISTVFIQLQYSSKGARLIADQLGAKVVTLDPYSPDYISAMRDIGRQFSAQPIEKVR